jgi:outer membrane lipoprotein LolB
LTRAGPIWLLAFALLSGCAGLAPVAQAPASDRLTGRISVQVDASSGKATAGSASFELSGGPEAGVLELTSPLGAVVARAQWQPGLARLQTPEQEREFPDLDELTRELLGEPVPVAALFAWLRGEPWAAASSVPMPGGFEQLGWRIDLTRKLERVLVAKRLAEPVVTLRARLEEVGDALTP